MRYFVGLDWASREHAVCVLDQAGTIAERFTVAHTADGMADLARRLTKRGTPAELRVAIERPTGLLVDSLVEGGFAVVPIHPNVVKATRPRYSAAQGKTDLGDAYLLADVLRTDGHRFRALTPLSDETKALRGLVRMAMTSSLSGSLSPTSSAPCSSSSGLVPPRCLPTSTRR